MPRLEASETVEAETAREHDVDDTGATAVTGGASSAFSPVVSSVAPPAVTPHVVPCVERRIAPPFVEHSTRYAMLRPFPLC